MASVRRSPFWLQHALAIALVLLLASRLAVVFGIDVQPSSDPAWYHARALELLDRGSYSERGVITAFWPVGYPAFLALVMSVFGRSPLVGQLANVALSALCLVLLYGWCRLRWADRRVAAVAVFLWAVYPNQIGYSAFMYSEPLFTALLLGMCLVSRPGAGIVRLALLGLLAGAATLVKSQTLLLAPLLIWVLLLSEWRSPAASDAARRALFAVLVMVLTVSPWTYRNYVQFGAFIPVSTNGGMSLLAGNNPSMSTSLAKEFSEDDSLLDSVRFSVADQVGADARARAAARRWIAENPGKFITLMPKKIARLWLWDGESEWMFQRGDPAYEQRQAAYRAVRLANQAFYLVVLAAGLLAIVRNLRPREPATLIVPLLMLFFTVISMVFSGQSRYHAPVMPFIVAAGASTFLWATLRWRRA